MSNTQDLERVLEKKNSILKGDAERIAKQRAQGKLVARERVAKLLDQGSFVETDALVSKDGDYAGVVTGYGTVQDRPVYLFAQDFTVHGGAMCVKQAEKILKVLDLAQKTGAPVIALCDSAGVRLEEGAQAMNAYAKVYAKMTRLSGVCPMVALVMGPCVGGAALISQLCDVSIMAENVGRLMVYGPQVMSAVSGKTYTDENAGGAKTMAAQGGVALTAENEDAAIALAVQVLDLLPGCNAEDAPLMDTDDMNRVLPEMDAGDSEALMAAMADAGSFVELYKDWGKEIRVALTRMGGRSVGVVASNAAVNDGEGCALYPPVRLLLPAGGEPHQQQGRCGARRAGSGSDAHRCCTAAVRLCGSHLPQGERGGWQCHWPELCSHGGQGQCRCDLRLAGCGDFRADAGCCGGGAL